MEIIFSCILFFHKVIVKHETHHLHDFMVKFVIFNVNRVNFDQEQCTVTLIQRKRCSKNRPGAETIAPLLLTRRFCLTLTRCSCSRCECMHLLTYALKKIRAVHAPLTLAVWNGRYPWCTLHASAVRYGSDAATGADRGHCSQCLCLHQTRRGMFQKRSPLNVLRAAPFR